MVRRYPLVIPRKTEVREMDVTVPSVQARIANKRVIGRFPVDLISTYGHSAKLELQIDQFSSLDRPRYRRRFGRIKLYRGS
jgi:hypothetical protein